MRGLSSPHWRSRCCAALDWCVDVALDLRVKAVWEGTLRIEIDGKKPVTATATCWARRAALVVLPLPSLKTWR
ncbi:hypothetical protein NXC14_PC00125 (plasmid) [Rhizobium sp. NXC14]|nr:hypothetical protein NXC14_PC00125 [Rhizobium sp. NXC14]